MKVKKVRDLTLVEIDTSKTMVIACDSCGSVGMKEGDFLKVPPYYTGRFTVRVALMEVLCTGARVVTIADAVCCEQNPTGDEIIKGIKTEMGILKLDDVVLTGSTEENFPTTSTGLGVTVIGIADSSIIKINSVKEECTLIAVGKPKVGGEIQLDNDMEIVGYEILLSLLNRPDVYEIVPVGSKGIAYEAELLARNNGFEYKPFTDMEVDVYKSAGPATAAIAAVRKESVDEIINKYNQVCIIGYLL